MDDPGMHEDHVTGIAGEFDGLHGNAGDIDGIHKVSLFAVSTQVAGPQIPQTRCRPLDRIGDVFGPALADQLRLPGDMADEPVRTGEGNRRAAADRPAVPIWRKPVRRGFSLTRRLRQSAGPCAMIGWAETTGPQRGR